MSKKIYLYNLRFLNVNDFNNFSINGYSFHAIPDKQPKRINPVPSDYFLKLNRGICLNSFVLIQKRQEGSIIFKDRKYSRHRKRKFLDDILLVISLLIGKNVVPRFYRKFNSFPLCSANHCSMVALNSKELEQYLAIAIPRMKDAVWQNRYDNGFHLNMFYNASNIFVTEHRYLAYISIWEYLFYCDFRNKPYAYFVKRSLLSKLNFLVKKYFVKKGSKIGDFKLKIFPDLRNQLSHNGKLPIQNPKSQFRKLGYIGCAYYMNMFERMTQILVLKTIGIDAVKKMDIFNVIDHLDDVIKKGFVPHFEEMDKAGIGL